LRKWEEEEEQEQEEEEEEEEQEEQEEEEQQQEEEEEDNQKEQQKAEEEQPLPVSVNKKIGTRNLPRQTIVMMMMAVTSSVATIAAMTVPSTAFALLSMTSLAVSRRR
jgi:hypothetical protein